MDPLWDQIYWNHLLIVSTTPGHAEYLDASGDKQGQHQGCDTCGSWDGRNFNMKKKHVFFKQEIKQILAKTNDYRL